MKIDDYPPEQVARIEWILAVAALPPSRRIRRAQIDAAHRETDLVVAAGQGFLEAAGDEHVELTPRGLYWLNRRLLIRRIDQGPPGIAARTDTPAPPQRRFEAGWESH